MRWSEEKLAEFQARHGVTQQVEPPAGKESKFHSKKVVAEGITWDSKGEYNRWCQLKMMLKGGLITDLQRQVSFILAPAVILEGRKKPAMKFTADFAYRECGRLVVEDFKSPITAEERPFRMRIHLMKSVHDIEVKIIMANKKK